MPPKKSANNVSKNAETLKTPKTTAPKPRIKKEKPKLKTPTIAKVKVSSIGPPKKSSDNVPASTESKTRMMLIVDRANEVARAQLVKNCPVILDSATENVKEPAKKARGRKKLTKVESERVVVDTEEKVAKPVPRKKTKAVPAAPAEKMVARNTRGRGVAVKKTPKVTNIAPPPNPKTPMATPVTEPKKRGRPKKVRPDDSVTTSPSILNGLMDPKKEIPAPAPKVATKNTESRRTSLNSGSELSCNISGSSTTTCITVCSADIVRIDGKVPVIKLNRSVDPSDRLTSMNNEIVNVNEEPEKKEPETSLCEDSSSSDSSTTTSSSSSSSSSSVSSQSVPLNSSQLCLSSTSTRSPTVTPFGSPKSKTNGVSNCEKLEARLKSIDLSFVTWDEDDDYASTDMKPFEAEVYKVMTEEREALMTCKLLRQILTDKRPADKTEEPESDFAKPETNLASGKPSQPPVEYSDCLDDDDALSLFAESISGMESSRVSSVAHDEYVPQPLRPRSERTYQPSRIDDSQKTKPVCEKQNADSTSVYREPEATIDYPRVALKQTYTRPEITRPILRLSTLDSSYGIKAVTLKGVCFFNLISNCKKAKCKFIHRPIDVDLVAERVIALSEVEFMQEYMVIGKWPRLRIKYSKCLIEECKRRELDIILIEMVVVYISKMNLNCKEDIEAKVEIVESALLYLNKVDLSQCEDLLKYQFTDGKMLCDVFIETIASTQNFGRFRAVFMNLVEFMVRIGKRFKVDVAGQILERVCIFASDAALAEVLLSVLENAEGRVERGMMRVLEARLEGAGADLRARLAALPAAPPAPPAPPPPAERRYTSPDTTNLDNVNKPVEPVITRTFNLDMIRALQPPVKRNFKKPSQNWMNRSIYDQIPRFLPPGPGRPLLRPPLKRPMGQAQYTPRQFKFPRRSGPDFYGNQ